MKPVFTFLMAVLFVSLLPQSLYSQDALTKLWQKPTSGYALRFSKDGKLLITGGSTGDCYPFLCGKIEVWNVADSNLINTITTQPVMGFVDDIDINKTSSIIISGNGSVYCAGEGGCSADRPGQYKFSVKGTVKKSLDNPGGNVYAIEYSPDETVVAAGTGYNNTGVINIYDTNFNLLRTLPGHQYTTTGLVFTPDGKYLVSGGDDGYLIFWDYKTGNLIRKLKHGDYFKDGTNIDVDASPDGRYVSSAGQYGQVSVKIWRVSDGKLIYTLPVPDNKNYDSYQTARFSADGKYIVSGTIQYKSGGVGYYGQILVWRLSDGKLITKIVDKDGGPQSGGIYTIAFSETNSLFAYIVNNTLKVFSVRYPGAQQLITANKLSENTISTAAFPNPFNAKTDIEYTIPSKQFVNLVIYNSFGKQVAVLVNEKKAAGKYHVTLNAETLSPGLYMYKLTVGNNLITKTILLER